MIADIAAEFFSVFPWWTPALFTAAAVVLSSLRRPALHVGGGDIQAPIQVSTPTATSEENEPAMPVIEDPSPQEAPAPTAPAASMVQVAAPTAQGSVTAVEPAATSVSAPKALLPDVNYLEVSHWWETEDEKVLIALGVDGSVHRLAKVDDGSSPAPGMEDGIFWAKLGAALRREAGSLRFKGTQVRLDIKKRKQSTGAGFDLGEGMVAVPVKNEATAAETPKTGAKGAALSDVDLLRVRLWRARASHSKQAGLVLVILSAVLFAGAFFITDLVLEIASVSSFVVGVALVAYETEPRVKLFPSMSSLIGPLKVVERELNKRGLSSSSAVFKSSDGEDSMSFEGSRGGKPAHYSTAPLGDGLVHSYEMEIGELAKMGVEGAKTWLPRVMTDGLGLAEKVEIKIDGDEVTTSMTRPFVRVLCVQDFMTAGLCKTTGCPLAASLGQSLARASGKAVSHAGCVYDPLAQKATLKDKIA